jgi:hypothetical protein
MSRCCQVFQCSSRSRRTASLAGFFDLVAADQHIADARFAQFAEGDFLRVGRRHGFRPRRHRASSASMASSIDSGILSDPSTTGPSTAEC